MDHNRNQKISRKEILQDYETKEELVDLLTIQIEETLPKEERIQSYMEQVRNPYHFKVGKVEVQVGFSEDGITFEQRFQEYLSCL